MTQDQMPRDILSLRGQFDVPIAAHAQISAARHALEGGCHRRRSDAQIFSEPRADRRLLFLHQFPDRFQVIFLGDASSFATHCSLLSATAKISLRSPLLSANAPPAALRAPR